MNSVAIKRNIRKGIYILPVIFWMGVIFGMSHQVAEVSSAMSGGIIDQIIQIIFPRFEEYSLAKQILYMERLEIIVRKGAHFSEYTVLGGLLARALYHLSGSEHTSKKNWCIKSWGIGVLYAMTDEIHQLFIDGRSGQLSDVMIDTSGVLLGVVLYAMVRKFVNNNLTDNKLKHII